MPDAALNPIEVDALRAGYHRVRSVMTLLDAINVFPVADADTGANLAASLSPLEREFASATELTEALLFAAQGNSGNISAAFLAGMFDAPSKPLPERFSTGEARARRAVADPQPGTMLTVLQQLVEVTRTEGVVSHTGTVEALAAAVDSTTSHLPVLAEHHVIDAGALGLFVFLETFLGVLTGSASRTDVEQRFRGRLAINGTRAVAPTAGRCIDAVLRLSAPSAETLAELRDLGDSTVLVQADNVIKLHVHASDPESLRVALAGYGELIRFDTSPLAPHSPPPTREPPLARAPATPIDGDTASGRASTPVPTCQSSPSIQVVTDAAGSLSAQQATELGIELLASRVSLPTGTVLETEADRESVWQALRSGHRVTTAQAPLAQRHQTFARLLEQHPCVLYLCVGSAYTGNHAAALEWAREQAVEDRFIVIDSGAASGKLAVVARQLATLATRELASTLRQRAQHLLTRADELLFIDRLEFLRRSGRLSAPSAWFGTLLGFKPVVTPTPQGARRVGICRDQRDQLELARRRLAELAKSPGCFVLLQHTDNEDWIRTTALPTLRKAAPLATIEVSPLSLTTAVHTGPGTWSVAFLPTEAEESPCA